MHSSTDTYIYDDARIVAKSFFSKLDGVIGGLSFLKIIKELCPVFKVFIDRFHRSTYEETAKAIDDETPVKMLEMLDQMYAVTKDHDLKKIVENYNEEIQMFDLGYECECIIGLLEEIELAQQVPQPEI